MISLLVALTLSGTDLTIVKNRQLERNETVAKALFSAGLDENTVDSVQGALKATGFDFKKARPFDQLRLVLRDGQLDLLDYRRSIFSEWQVRREGDRYVGKKGSLEK